MASSPQGSLHPRGRKPPPKRVRLLYERRVSLFALLVAELFVWWLLAMALQEQTTRPLQTLANVISALREEDYSFRARGAATDDALGELSIEVNSLADLLADQRILSIEATALLR